MLTELGAKGKIRAESFEAAYWRALHKFVGGETARTLKALFLAQTEGERGSEWQRVHRRMQDVSYGLSLAIMKSAETEFAERAGAF